MKNALNKSSVVEFRKEIKMPAFWGKLSVITMVKFCLFKQMEDQKTGL